MAVFTNLIALRHQISDWVNWCYVYSIRVFWHQAKIPSLNDLEVLKKSTNFIVVNKEESVLINTDDPCKLSVAAQLKHCYPELVDHNLQFGFRYVG